MEWLLTSLLKMSKIDAGTAVFRKDSIHVWELIDQVVKPIQIPMELKEQRLEISGSKEVSFIGDFKWSVEALINIVKNCIEHTPKGGMVSIAYEENALYTQIKIVDTGIGIDREDLPFIFSDSIKEKMPMRIVLGLDLPWR